MNEDGSAGKAIAAASIVNHIDLADVGAGLKFIQRNIKLEGDSIAVADVDGVCLDERRFIHFSGAVQELNTGEDMDWVFGAGFGFSRGLFVCRVIEFIEQVEVLVLPEYMGYVGDPLNSVANERAGIFL